jgi:hypothetical protein
MKNTKIADVVPVVQGNLSLGRGPAAAYFYIIAAVESRNLIDRRLMG